MIGESIWDETMDVDAVSPIDASADAVLELEELKQGYRTDAPSFSALFHFIRTPRPSPEFEGRTSMSMLADLRSYTILRDSVSSIDARLVNQIDVTKAIEKYLSDLESGVDARKSDKIDEAKRFCASFNGRLLANEFIEIYQRKERADSRYISDESLP